MKRWFGFLKSARTWVVLAILAPVGMLAISADMLIDLRREAWDRAEQNSKNLLQLIDRDIQRNVEIIDLSLSAVIDNLRAPGVDQASPELRQLVLFDRAITARDIGVMLVLDENGDSILDAAGYPARKLNNADRDYFKAHKANPDLGLDISKPLISRLTNDRIVVLSRRINKPDGSFGGVVLASLRLAYFQRLFDRIGLGREGAINLYLHDGTRVMRYPYLDSDIGVNIASSQNFQHFVTQPPGSFVAQSIRDGVQRLYTYTRVGDLPLVLNVAMATEEIEAAWRGKAFAIGAVLLALFGLTAGLAILFGGELRRRAEMQAELARLSQTDGLTGLPNRRHFDQEFARASDDCKRRAQSLSLLIIDADHFKRFNDRYGHSVGDDVLKGIARKLSGSVHRPGDFVARIGGEEFAVILSDTDDAGAAAVAAKIHEEISGLSIDGAGIGAGAVTVSIGLAGGGAGATSREELYRLADAALYDAKARGRNQTRAARAIASARPPMMRLVNPA